MINSKIIGIWQRSIVWQKLSTVSQKSTEAEIIRKIKGKQRRREKQESIQLQKRLNKISHTNSAIKKVEFPDLALECVENIYKILIGDLVGHSITHNLEC